ncbi:MAG: class I SAM-dependent methyltransferase [Pseudomonadota bacterium]
MKHVDVKIDFFNNLAADWNEMSESLPPSHLSAIISLSGIKRSATVLDAGCGTGILLPALLEAVGDSGRIKAIDPAQKMLDILQDKYRDHRIEVRCETMENSSFDDSSLDAIICFSCFPHLSDKPAALANVERMLKTGRRLVIAHASSRKEVNAFHAGCSGPVRNDVLPDEREMTVMMQDAGLRVVHYRDEPGRYELVAEKLR